MKKLPSSKAFWICAVSMIAVSLIFAILLLTYGRHPVLSFVIFALIVLCAAFVIMLTFSERTSHVNIGMYAFAVISIIVPVGFGFMSVRSDAQKEQPVVQIDTLRTIHSMEERFVLPDGTKYYKSVIETTVVVRGVQNSYHPIELHYATAYLQSGVDELEKYNDIIARYEADSYTFDFTIPYVMDRLQMLGYTWEQIQGLSADIQSEHLRKIGYSEDQVGELCDEALLNEWFKSGEQYEMYERWHSEYEFYIMVAYNHRGAIYDRMGEYEKALSDQFRALEMNDRGYKSDILNCIGLVYYHMGEYDKALDYYTQEIEVRGKKSSYDRGIVYMAMERYEEAVAEFQTELNCRYYRPAKVYNNLALSFIGLGRNDEALKAFTDAIDMVQGDAFSYDVSYLPPNEAGGSLGPRKFYRYNQSFHGNPDYEYEDWCRYHQGRRYKEYNSPSKYYYNRGVLYSQLGLSDLAERDFHLAEITRP